MKKILLALTALAIPSMAEAQSTPPWKSYQQTGNPADIVPSAGTPDSVAQWMGKKVDVTGGASNDQTLKTPSITGGSSTGQVLIGAQVPQLPADVPGHAGIGLPNTLWVDKYYAPKGWFIASDTTWTVCASGCQYSDVVAAFHDAMQANYLGNAILTISIADGTYTMSDQLLTRNPNGVHVHIIGNVADNSKVVLNFNNKANGIGGFTAMDGGVIGYVNGITINGIGGIQSETDTVTTWVENSWGPGFYAARGGIIEAGPNVTVNHFYYSALADEGGYFIGDGMTGTDAGDVGFIARHNGVLRCIGCTAIRAADDAGHVGAEDGDPVNLGCNYTAENGGTLIITQAKGAQSHIAAVCALTNGHVWADMFVGTGGLGGAIGQGLWAISGGVIQANHAALSGYLNGAYAGAQGVIQSNNATYSNNADDGVDADAGTFIGSSDTIQNNAVHGASAFHQGMMQLYNTFATMTGNGTVGFVEPAGTSNGLPYAASSLYLQ